MAGVVRHRIGYADALKLTTSLCLTYTLLVAGLRTWVRRSIYGVDDIVVSVATVICLGHFAANYAALSYGAGDPWNSISQADVHSLNQASFASVATFVLALYTSKAAVIAFLARISQQKQHVLLYWTCLGLVVASGLASVFLVTLGWPLKTGYYFAFYENEKSCDVATSRWAIFTALDIFTEILLLILPLILLWGLQMRIKEKAKILTAFYLRLPVIGFSIGRLVYTQNLCSASTDIGKGSALVLIFLEVEASYAIVSSTFSAIKAFTSNFNSGFGFGFTQHAGADDYVMSRVRKYGDGSATGSAAGTGSRHEPSPAPPHTTSLKSQTVSHDREVSSHLRPTSPLGDVGRNTTQIRASPLASTYNENQWDDRSDESQEGQLENGIMRHTEYSVRHSDLNDERPILRNPSLGYGRERG